MLISGNETEIPKHADSQVLDNGETVVTVNNRGYVRIFTGRETYDDCHDIIQSQEIDLNVTSAVLLRNKLNEWFPQAVDLSELTTDQLLNELMSRDLGESGIEKVEIDGDISIYANNYGYTCSGHNCDGILLVKVIERPQEQSNEPPSEPIVPSLFDEDGVIR